PQYVGSSDLPKDQRIAACRRCRLSESMEPGNRQWIHRQQDHSRFRCRRNYNLWDSAKASHSPKESVLADLVAAAAAAELAAFAAAAICCTRIRQNWRTVPQI